MLNGGARSRASEAVNGSTIAYRGTDHSLAFVCLCQESKAERQQRRSSTVGEESEMPDAHEARR